MLIDKVTGKVETNLVGKTFQVKLTAESFRNMVGNIYSNQIEAIVRELSCNAYDSHIAAKCEQTPFRIHFPTVLEPYFEIEDFGVGLDDKEMEQVYTVLYNSTKDNSNDFTGAFGIGAKVPFVYTDNFIVKTVKYGIERVYSLYISEAGNPSYALMGESPTSKGNGLTVTFPVEQKDFDEFNKSSNCLRWFPTKPSVNINIEFEKDYNSILEFDYNGHSIKAELETPRSGFVMGNVFYPYNLGHSIRYHVPIGMLQIPMSRESIINNDKNKVVINDLRLKASEKFCENINEKIKNSPTYIDACFSLNDYSSRDFGYFNFADNIKWQGIKLYNQYILFNNNCTLISYCSKYDFKQQNIRINNGYTNKSSETKHLKLHKNLVYLVNDGLKKSHWARVKKVVRDEKLSSTIYFIDNPVMQFYDEIGLSKYFIKASTVKLPKIQRNKNQIVCEFKNYRWYDSVLDSNKKGLLVLKNDYSSNNMIRFLSNKLKLINTIYQENIIIYGCYAKDYEKILKNNPNIKKFDDYLKEKEEADIEFKQDYKLYRDVCYNYNSSNLDLIHKLKMGDEFTKMHKQYKNFENNEKFTKKIKIFNKYCERKSIEEVLINKYPLLKYIDYYSVNTQEDCDLVAKMIKQEIK